MPPRDLCDINPVYRPVFFNSYLNLFVSNQYLVGYSFHLLEESTMTDEEYNEHAAIPSAFDVPDDNILVRVSPIASPVYYTDEEMVYDSDASTCSEDSVIDMIVPAFLVIGVGMVYGCGTAEDPYDLTNA